MQHRTAVTCKYPGCENEPHTADDGAGRTEVLRAAGTR